MTPYIDVGFLSVLLVKTPGRRVAWRTLQRFPPPYPLNYLHHLQIENLLVRCQLDSDDKVKAVGLEGARLWKSYTAEASSKSVRLVGIVPFALPSVGRVR